jgi:Fuc2NAc and GlcNAc transferase
MELFLFAGCSVLVAAVLTYVIRIAAVRQGVLDLPNHRSSHVEPTPRGGGLAIVVCALAALAWLGASQRLPLGVSVLLGVGGGIIAGTGYIDDRRGLPPLPRFVVHVVASILAVITYFSLSETAQLGYVEWLTAALLVLCATWSINLFNFMDGIDGIAASQAVFICTASAILFPDADSNLTGWLVLVLATAGASLGFLVWNWSPARIFMGDVGSGFLGFWLVALALALDAVGILSFWTSVILNALFIGDATATVVRRVLSGERWYEAHRSHVYQAFARRWRSHRKVTSLAWFINIVVLLPLAYVSTLAETYALGIALCVLFVVVAACFALGAGAPEQREPV